MRRFAEEAGSVQAAAAQRPAWALSLPAAWKAPSAADGPSPFGLPPRPVPSAGSHPRGPCSIHRYDQHRGAAAFLPAGGAA